GCASGSAARFCGLSAADRAIAVAEGTHWEVPVFVALQSAAAFAEAALGVLRVARYEAYTLRAVAIAEGTP
ncbi:MAG: hypothetical protein ABSG37_14980, partial [Candidatus Limnocylindrales bacterium]